MSAGRKSTLLLSTYVKGLAKYLGTMASTHTRPYTIIVEGNVGSGKTTFLETFQHNQGNKIEVLVEPIEMWRNCRGHNLLQLVFQDPIRYSLMFQSYVQLTMAKLHNQPTQKPIRMMERSLLSARYCFVESLHNSGLMADCEYSVISEWFDFLITFPKLDFKVDQIIYLRTRPEVAYERILKRNRPEEKLMSFSYLQDLHTLHEEWLIQKTKFQPLAAVVTVIDANEDLSSLTEKFASIKADIVAKYS